MRLARRLHGSVGNLGGARGLAFAGAVGFVVVPILARFSESNTTTFGVWRFLVISIALFAFAYGLRGGVGAAASAIALSATWQVAGHVNSLGTLDVVLRSINYALAGVIVGWLVESRWRAVGELARHVELSSDVIVSGGDGYLDEVNPAFTRILGYSRSEAVGRPYLDFVHPDDHEGSRGVEQELTDGHGPITSFENRYRHVDGTYRWLQWSVNIDERMGKGFAVGRDVTARKEAEEREQQVLADLRESLAVQEDLQHRLATVIESMVDGVIEMDESGTVVSFNAAAERIFGYGRDEVLGRDLGMLIADTDDVEQPGHPKADEPAAVGAAREVTGRRKDGSVFPLDLALSETTVADKKVVVASVRDITDRKLAEERDRHYRQTLEWAVRDRTRELQEQTTALEEARIDTLQRLAMAGEYHDEDTHQHTERVGHTAALLAQELGSMRDWVKLIRLAAPLHDLGKLSVSDAILLKQGPLDDTEWEQVKNHPLVGAAILAGSSSEVLHLAEEIALTHHEWWDGSGYPAGLAGNDIPISGRIVTVADTFDALTHDRPYKPAWSIAEAVDEIRRLSGSRFDPMVVDAFERLDHRHLTETPAPDAAVTRIQRRPHAQPAGGHGVAADTGTAA